MSMNIFLAKKGNKVRFTNRGGWTGEWEHASSILKHGEVYLIDRVEIYQSSSDVYLQGYEDQCFNSVFFEDVGVADYMKIEELTNEAFTKFVRNEVERFLKFRDLEQFFITIDDADTDDRDEWTIVIDAKFTGLLWTAWFSKHSGRWNREVIGERLIERYNTISKGNRADPPGVYIYDSEEEFKRNFPE